MVTYFTNQEIKELRCSVCNTLGSFEFGVCSNGSIVCGKCEASGNNSLPTVKVPLLDSVLKTCSFACKFRNAGCVEVLSFDFIDEHESKCMYHSCVCIVQECHWKGLRIELHKHFAEKHAHCLQVHDVCLPAFENQSVEDIIVKSIMGALFLFEYKYDSGNLQIKASYVSSYVKEASYIITHKNDDAKQLVVWKCYPFGTEITSDVLDITNYCNNSLQIKINPTIYNSYFIDYSLINSIKCDKCMGYLIPIPMRFTSGRRVCGFCALYDKDKIADPDHLTTRTFLNTKFPCKWKYCSVIANSLSIFEHQNYCKFRIHECLLNRKCGFMTFSDMIIHLTNVHNIEYFENEYLMTDLETTHIFFSKKNMLILVSVNIVEDHTVCIEIRRTGGYQGLPVYVQCIHSHCNIKSKCFIVLNKFNITAEQLPPCFKDQQTFSLIFKTSQELNSNQDSVLINRNCI